MTGSSDQYLARKARMVAIVIAATMVLWLVAQGIGDHFGWSPRFAFLFDMMAIAAFIWSLFIVYQIWRDRQHNQG